MKDAEEFHATTVRHGEKIIEQLEQFKVRFFIPLFFAHSDVYDTSSVINQQRKKR